MVSVVIPVYNRETTIERAIRSVLEQTYSDFEIIVVDDGSEDNSSQVIRSLQQGNDKIRYYYQKNSGPSAARNKGITEARGEYIAFLDSDDYWYPQKLAKQMALFETHPEVGIVYCWAEVINHRGKKWCKSPKYTGHVFEDLLAEGNFIPTSGTLAKRQTLLEVGGFDEALKSTEDWDLWLRITSNYEILCAKELLVRKHESRNGLQHSHKVMFENVKKVLFKYIEMIDDPNKKRVYLAKYYRRSLAIFYDAPNIYSYLFEMIKAHPPILFHLKTYRYILSFIKSNCYKLFGL